MSKEEGQNLPFTNGQVIKLKIYSIGAYIGAIWEGFAHMLLVAGSDSADGVNFTVTVVDPTANQIALNYEGYVFVYPGSNKIFLGQDSIDDTCKFTVTNLGNNNITLLSTNGQYVTDSFGTFSTMPGQENATVFTVEPVA